MHPIHFLINDTVWEPRMKNGEQNEINIEWNREMPWNRQ